MRGLAEAIGAITGAQTVSLPRESATDVLGPLALILGAPGTLDRDKARETFDWAPVGGSILDDIRTGSYRASGAATVEAGA